MLNDDIFGQIQFEIMWQKKDNYFLYGKEFEITLFIQGEKDEAPTNIQKEAYISFINKKMILMSEIEEKVFEYYQTVCAEYREQDLSYGRMDLNVFFMRLQEQDDEVASWSDATINKIKQVLNKILIENEYIDNPRATRLNPVMISSEVDNAIRADGNDIALQAFNCFY